MLCYVSAVNQWSACLLARHAVPITKIDCFLKPDNTETMIFVYANKNVFNVEKYCTTKMKMIIQHKGCFKALELRQYTGSSISFGPVIKASFPKVCYCKQQNNIC